MERKALNILIVDDDQDDKDFITDTILKQAPIANVLGLESGTEAFDYLSTVSTANERAYRKECLAHGANRYFEKPSDMAHWGHSL